MTQPLRKQRLSFLIVLITIMSSCKKNDELKPQIADLQSRVSNIENQISQINNNLVVVGKLNKLTSDKIAGLKALTSPLTVKAMLS